MTALKPEGFLTMVGLGIVTVNKNFSDRIGCAETEENKLYFWVKFDG
jgi:hypothetical protein